MTKNLKYYLDLPYKIELHFEPGDSTWVASHPELGRGSCYAIAPTKEYALALLEEEKKSLIELAISEGKEIPEPQVEEDLPSGQFITRLPRSLHKSLKEKADKEGVSLNHLVVTYLSTQISFENALSVLEDKITKLWEINSRNTLRTFWSFAVPSVPIVKVIKQKKELSDKSSYSDSFEILAEQLMGNINVKTKEIEQGKKLKHLSYGIQKPAFQD